jgi:negative regulator of sigma E activity
MMMKLRHVMTLAVALSLLAASVHADDNDAKDLLKKVRDTATKLPFKAKMTMTSDRGWTRELELSHKHMDEVEASYMEVTSPMDLKDTRFLVFDHEKGPDQQFIYVPAAKRAIQVGSQTRKQEFLGSEFAVGDLVQPNIDNYNYRFVGEEDINGRHCKLVEAIPKNPADEMYSKTVIAVDPKDMVVARTQFYDDKGKLLKVWTIEKMEKIDGIWTPLKQLMTNVQDNHWTRLDLSNIKYNAQLPDEVFNRSYLIR